MHMVKVIFNFSKWWPSIHHLEFLKTLSFNCL